MSFIHPAGRFEPVMHDDDHILEMPHHHMSSRVMTTPLRMDGGQMVEIMEEFVGQWGFRASQTIQACGISHTAPAAHLFGERDAAEEAG